MSKCENKKCKANQICNPKTGRCVKRTGATGKKLLAKSKSRRSKSRRSKSMRKSKSRRRKSKSKSRRRKSNNGLHVSFTIFYTKYNKGSNVQTMLEIPNDGSVRKIKTAIRKFCKKSKIPVSGKNIRLIAAGRVYESGEHIPDIHVIHNLNVIIKGKEPVNPFEVSSSSKGMSSKDNERAMRKFNADMRSFKKELKAQGKKGQYWLQIMALMMQHPRKFNQIVNKLQEPSRTGGHVGISGRKMFRDINQADVDRIQRQLESGRGFGPKGRKKGAKKKKKSPGKKKKGKKKGKSTTKLAAAQKRNRKMSGKRRRRSAAKKKNKIYINIGGTAGLKRIQREAVLRHMEMMRSMKAKKQRSKKRTRSRQKTVKGNRRRRSRTRGQSLRIPPHPELVRQNAFIERAGPNTMNEPDYKSPMGSPDRIVANMEMNPQKRGDLSRVFGMDSEFMPPPPRP